MKSQNNVKILLCSLIDTTVVDPVPRDLGYNAHRFLGEVLVAAVSSWTNVDTFVVERLIVLKGREGLLAVVGLPASRGGR